MRQIIGIAVLLALLTPASQARSANLLSDMLGGYAKCWPNCVRKVCCDDYCAKPMPCARGVCEGLCPDYCKKCEPCARPWYCKPEPVCTDPEPRCTSDCVGCNRCQ